MRTVRAGVASADITPAVGGMMDGYGGRLTPSQGVHDPLSARVLVLDYGDAACAIIGCDLLGIHTQMTAEVRRRAGESTSIAEEAVVLAALHNHAGPVGLRAGMFSRYDDTLAEATIAKIVVALERAWSSRKAVMIKTGETIVDTVGMNRRDPEWPSDATLRVVLFDGEEGPVASLLNFACHATVLSGANLMLSGEFPAVACRIVEAATGAGAVYLNAACGDVNPMWVRQDFASVERAGQAVGGAAVRLIADLRAAGDGIRAHNIRWDEFPERAVRGRVVQPRLRTARREIELPLREFEADEKYASRIEAARADADNHPASSPGRREAMACFQRFEGERWAAAWARRSGEAGTRRVEVQAMSLGDGLGLLALPGEFFAETGEMIRGASGIEQLLIACYANDYIGYVVPEHAFDEGGYESGVTFFAGEAEAIIRKTSGELLREVSRDGD
jgi:neutral ceramidase